MLVLLQPRRRHVIQLDSIIQLEPCTLYYGRSLQIYRKDSRNKEGSQQTNLNKFIPEGLNIRYLDFKFTFCSFILKVLSFLNFSSVFLFFSLLFYSQGVQLIHLLNVWLHSKSSLFLSSILWLSSIILSIFLIIANIQAPI